MSPPTSYYVLKVCVLVFNSVLKCLNPGHSGMQPTLLHVIYFCFLCSQYKWLLSIRPHRTSATWN